MEGREALAAAEAESRSGLARRLSGTLLPNAALAADAAYFQSATNLTATSSGVSPSAAVTSSMTNTGFRCTVASLFSSTRYRYC